MTGQNAPVREREGVNVNAWIDEDIGKAFERLVDEFRPRGTKRGHLEEAIREYCQKLGFWPAPEEPGK